MVGVREAFVSLEYNSFLGLTQLCFTARLIEHYIFFWVFSDGLKQFLFACLEFAPQLFCLPTLSTQVIWGTKIWGKILLLSGMQNMKQTTNCWYFCWYFFIPGSKVHLFTIFVLLKVSTMLPWWIQKPQNHDLSCCILNKYELFLLQILSASISHLHLLIHLFLFSIHSLK